MARHSSKKIGLVRLTLGERQAGGRQVRIQVQGSIGGLPGTASILAEYIVRKIQTRLAGSIPYLSGWGAV
jgi:hypothetical protein